MNTTPFTTATPSVDFHRERASLAAVRPALRVGAQDPYVRLQHVTLFVLDPERSLRFYVGCLGFDIVADLTIADGARLMTVAPPDGTATLTLFSPQPDTEEYKRIGQATHVVFLTEDVPSKYREWRERGVLFHHSPVEPAWGGSFTTFEDPDGNAFVLVGFDEATREVEALRRRTAEAQDRERRAEYEFNLARAVQRKLLPTNQALLANLDYAGQSVPARIVGGDYYDFLDLAPGHLGFVLGDVSGSGFPAALLMANLQAILRSQFRRATQDLLEVLQSVNRLFHENTESGHYATLFVGLYDDFQRRLSYVNCGHRPPLLLHSNGEVDFLEPTATVLGLSTRWDCSVSEARLARGDALVMYTDGITDTENGNGEEFGVARLMETLRNNTGVPASVLLQRAFSAVEDFRAGEQTGDMSLVIATYRTAPERPLSVEEAHHSRSLHANNTPSPHQPNVPARKRLRSGVVDELVETHR